MVGDREARRASLYFRPMRESPSGANLVHHTSGRRNFAVDPAVQAQAQAQAQLEREARALRTPRTATRAKRERSPEPLTMATRSGSRVASSACM